MFILVDNQNVVRDAASYEESLGRLEDKALTLYEVGDVAFYGDEYDPKTGAITRRPENYPQPTTDELAEIQIQAEMRRQAVAALKTRGVLPEDYVDKKDVPEAPVTREIV